MSVTINVKLKRETDKAILVEYDGEDIWLPKSQLESIVNGPIGMVQDIDISDWIAEQKDITMSASERYIVEPSNIATVGGGPINYAVKDTSINPVHIMCICAAQRDADIIAASLEMTKNKR
jgi:hypothetical protein